MKGISILGSLIMQVLLTHENVMYVSTSENKLFIAHEMLFILIFLYTNYLYYLSNRLGKHWHLAAVECS